MSNGNLKEFYKWTSGSGCGLLSALAAFVAHLLAHLFVLVLPHLLTPLLDHAAHIENLVMFTPKENERRVGYRGRYNLSRPDGTEVPFRRAGGGRGGQ